MPDLTRPGLSETIRHQVYCPGLIISPPPPFMIIHSPSLLEFDFPIIHFSRGRTRKSVSCLFGASFCSVSAVTLHVAFLFIYLFIPPPSNNKKRLIFTDLIIFLRLDDATKFPGTKINQNWIK